jgi:PAS domain S-box-containing protein
MMPILLFNAAVLGFAVACLAGALVYVWAHRRWGPVGNFAILSLALGGYAACLLSGWLQASLLSELTFLVLLSGVGCLLLLRERRLLRQRPSDVVEKFKRILESFPLAVAWTDSVGNIEYMNPRASQVFGYTLEDIPTVDHWFQCVYPDPEIRQRLIEEWDRLTEQARLTGKPIEPGMYRITCKDGSIKNVEISATRFDDFTLVVFKDITEKIIAEAKLRERENMFSKLFKGVPVLLGLNDFNTGEFLEVNDEASRISGFSREEIIGRNSVELGWVTPEDRIRLANELKSKGRIDCLEMEFHAKNGHTIVGLVEGEHFLFFDRDCLLTVTVDITERKRAEEQLQESLTKLEIAQEVAKIGFWNVELSDMKVEWSQGIKTIFGLPPDSPTPTHEEFLDFVVVDDREFVKEMSNKECNLTVEPETSYIYRIVAKDGTHKYLEHVGKQIFNSNGQLIKASGSVQDVTERKHAEEVQQRLDRELRAISDCNQTLLRAENEQRLLDEICRIICDEAGYRMAWVGYPEYDEAKSLRPVAWAGYEDGYLSSISISWADTDLGHGPSGTAIRNGEVVYTPDFEADPDMAVWYEMYSQRGYRSSIALPLKDVNDDTFGCLTIYSSEPYAFKPDEIRLMEELSGDLAFGIGVLRSRIELKRAEEEVRRFNQELEHRVSQRTSQLESANSELEAFSYSVSHDLRAPLRHIAGFVEMLEEHLGNSLDEKSRGYMATISKATKRMGMLIDDLLSFARMARHDLSEQPVNLADMVNEIINELEPEVAGKNVQWRLGDLPVVLGDRALLRTVMDNLISNALKFTRSREQAEIVIGSSHLHGDIVVFIRDNGVGFDPNNASKLFGVFQRLHSSEEYEGTGIGLANVRRIISRHGGRTWADGAIDQGATFYFSLPNGSTQ